ncbi:ABC transporter ATP-binding protein [Sphingomonas sp.]|jgi:NitT/TauT family transport system ATP-binding protein|uniref:ABC transporter ATP-binding protein n=1 Tax=Sphingomonas sp. TaxID=28214 RepID=UPI002EDB9DF7
MLRVDRLAKSYGSARILDGISFSVARGEFVCIVGPSGCGKTTLLRCLSGLMAAEGDVILADARVTRPPAQMALVFQDYRASLMPWLSVADNIKLPLVNQRLPRAEIEERARESLGAVSLEGFAEHYPWQLSGGMQQRVAIARALAYRPEILLMDEPFASVDAQTRADLEDLLLDIHHRFGMTTLLVTHDVDEAVFLADRVLVLSGRPTRVKEEIVVDLPSPRDQVATKELAEFTRLRAHVFSGVRKQGVAMVEGH